MGARARGRCRRSLSLAFLPWCHSVLVGRGRRTTRTPSRERLHRRWVYSPAVEQSRQYRVWTVSLKDQDRVNAGGRSAANSISRKLCPGRRRPNTGEAPMSGPDHPRRRSTTRSCAQFSLPVAAGRHHSTAPVCLPPDLRFGACDPVSRAQGRRSACPPVVAGRLAMSRHRPDCHKPHHRSWRTTCVTVDARRMPA
jgi:hypothetical protein